MIWLYLTFCFFFFQAEDGIRDLVRSRGLGDVYKRQALTSTSVCRSEVEFPPDFVPPADAGGADSVATCCCLLYTSDAADERSSVDLGGRRIIKKKKNRRSLSSSVYRVQDIVYT